jgi:hypothetical protein
MNKNKRVIKKPNDNWKEICKLVKNRKLEKKQLFEEKFSSIKTILHKTFISLQIQRNIYKEIVDLIKIRKTYADIYSTGKYYGYPKCCINDFVMNHYNNKTSSKLQELAGGYTGYVPCIKCSKLILYEKTKIEDIIKNRIYKKPFPIDEENDNGFIPCKIHALHLFKNKMTSYEIIHSKCKKCIIGKNCFEEDEISE